MGPSSLGRAGRCRPGRLLALLLGSLVTASLGVACGVADGPELLTLSSVEPGLVETGGTLVVKGRGFPAGRDGTVELAGVGLLPGRDPAQVRAPLRGHAVSSGRVVVELGQPEVRALTGGAPHATFRGTLQLAFEPVHPGAPALRGHIEDLSLDVVSPAAQVVAPGDFAAFLGLTLGADLSVVAVEPGLEAEAAGLRIGDRLHRLDGVRLLTLADFAPRQHGTTSLLEYSRPGYTGRGQALLARADYFRTSESEVWLTVSLALAVLLGALLAARPPRWAVWLLQTQRRLGPRIRNGSGLRAPWLGSFLWAAVGALGLAGLRTALGGSLALELPLLGGACVGALLLSALLIDGRSAQRGFSLLRAFWGASQSLVGLLPLAVAWAVAATQVGSLSLCEIAASQASAPLGLGLLSSVWSLLGGVAYLLALVPLGGERPPTGNALAPRAPGLRALEHFGLTLGLCLWVLIYGGALVGSSAPLPWVLGAELARLALLSAFVHWLRRVGGRLRRGESWGVWSFPVLALSFVAAGGRCLSLGFGLVDPWDERLRYLPLALSVSTFVWLVLAALRSLSHQGRRADPWL